MKKEKKKKVYTDLARFWRACDEFSRVYKPTWISSLPYTRVWVIAIQGMKRCCVVLDFYEELWFQLQKINKNCLGSGSTHKWNVEVGLDLVLLYKCKLSLQFWKSVPIWSNPVCTNQNWNGHNSFLLTKVGTHPTLVPKSHTLLSNVLWVKFYFV